MNFLPLLLIFLIILLPGLAVWLLLAKSIRLSGLESLFICLLAGTAVVSWLSLTLAEFSLFSLPVLLGLILFPGGLVIGQAVWQGPFWQTFSGLTWHWQDGIVGALLLVSVVLSGRPSEYIIGGRDHGVYVNTAIHIAKTGGIIVVEPEIESLPPESRTALVWPETRTYQAGFPGPWSEGQRMSGLTIRDLDEGVYLPHAFHLYPALMAFFFAVGGISTALYATLFLALLGSLAIYVTTARVWGQSTGLLTLVLLTFSVTQVWFMGYPTAEMMVQVFFWGGLFALILMLEGEGRVTAVLAGSCFGLLHLAKLDTVLVPVTAGALFLYFWLRDRFKPAYWWGMGAYLLLSVQALVHASFIATIYFLDHAIRNLLPAFLAGRLVAAADGYSYPTDWIGRFVTANWLLLLIALLVPVVGLGLLYWLRPKLAPLLAKLIGPPRRWSQVVVVGLLVVTVGTAVPTQFLVTTELNGATQAVHLSRLYLTRAGLIIGFLGILLLVYQANTIGKRAALFLLAGNMAPLYFLGAGTSPDHFWVIRRFMPIAFPSFLLAMAALIWFLWSLRQSRWMPARWPIRIVAAGILLVILAGFFQHIRHIARVVEFDGLTGQLESFAQNLPADAVLLIQTGTPAQQFSLPLWFLFDKSVFSIRHEVKEDAVLATAVASWQTSDRDVFWVATQETPPPSWQNWLQEYQFTYSIDVPQMEMPSDRIPHQLEQLHIELIVYKLVRP
ncbi:MAG: hypothetical protein IPM53_27970 [Anaerolineaceae bacterium]|nr:hypothetical protein [Anaerolineaceae bacterium]